MAGDDMDLEVAEKQLKSLENSEQHYFNRRVCLCPYQLCRTSKLTSALQL